MAKSYHQVRRRLQEEFGLRDKTEGLSLDGALAREAAANMVLAGLDGAFTWLSLLWFASRRYFLPYKFKEFHLFLGHLLCQLLQVLFSEAPCPWQHTTLQLFQVIPKPTQTIDTLFLLYSYCQSPSPIRIPPPHLFNDCLVRLAISDFLFIGAYPHHWNKFY